MLRVKLTFYVEKKTAAKDYSKFSLDNGFNAVITAEFRKRDYAREPKTTYIDGWISAQQFYCFHFSMPDPGQWTYFSPPVK